VTRGEKWACVGMAVAVVLISVAANAAGMMGVGRVGTLGAGGPGGGGGVSAFAITTEAGDALLAEDDEEIVTEEAP
jgi:hypothetical protein